MGVNYVEVKYDADDARNVVAEHRKIDV